MINATRRMPHILFHLGPELPVLVIELSQWRELRQSLPFARPDLVMTSRCKGGADARLREKLSIRADFNDYLRMPEAECSRTDAVCALRPARTAAQDSWFLDINGDRHIFMESAFRIARDEGVR